KGSRSEDHEVGYDNTDDCLRDVMDYTSYLDLDSPTSHLSVIPAATENNELQQLVSSIQEVAGQDLVANNNGPTSPNKESDHEDSSPEDENTPAPNPAHVTRRTLRSSTQAPD
ncbi:unnamed protein product, partial [Ectocarpus sp. 13 AM-2016]